MTKKHFEAMADYIASAKRSAQLREIVDPLAGYQGRQESRQAHVDSCYEFALYLCNKFGERFDRAKFDAWIERKVKV